MLPSEELEHLVKSLTISGVRHFRAFARRKVEDTALLKLFDLIYNRKKYDEKAFAKIVAVANFPALKVRLRDLLAESLLEQEMKKKGPMEIAALCAQIDIFQRQELMGLMWLMMDRAMALCERYEMFHTWRELLHRKQTILMMDAGVGYTPEGLEGFDELNAAVWAKFKNLDAYLELEEMVTLAARRGYAAMYEVATTLLNHPLLADDAQLLSVRAEIKYYFVKRNILQWTNQSGKALECAERVVALLDDNSALMTDETLYQMYASRISSIGLYAAAKGNVEKVDSTVARLQALAAYPVFIFERLHPIELRLAMQQLDLAKGEEVIAKIEKGLTAHVFKLSRDRQLAYYYQVAHFFLYFSEPKKALKWVQKLREADFVPTKKGLQDFAEILHLVCHYDLGNYKFLKLETKKVIGYLQKRNALTPYEEAIATGIRWVAMATSETIRGQRLLQFGEKVATLAVQPQFVYKANYFQFHLWIAAKVEGGVAAKYLLSSADKLD